MNLSQIEMGVLEALSHRFTEVPDIVGYIWPAEDNDAQQNWRYVGSIKATLGRLVDYKLVVQVGDRYALTPEGEKELKG